MSSLWLKFKILDWRMLRRGDGIFLQQKIAPPFFGETLLNVCIIILFKPNASKFLNFVVLCPQNGKPPEALRGQL
jgi:hypothetical protein